MSDINDNDALRRIYVPAKGRAVEKQIDYLDVHCRNFIELSPFLVLSSHGSDGRSDASPRGGPAGFVKVLDDKRLAFGDSPGNNRLDSLTNTLTNPQVGLLFLIPGVNETLRVNGIAHSTDDAQLREAMNVERKLPATVMVVQVQEAYLHCAKALMRSKIWAASSQVERSVLPSMGQMIKEQSNDRSDTPVEAQTVMEERYKDMLY